MSDALEEAPIVAEIYAAAADAEEADRIQAAFDLTPAAGGIKFVRMPIEFESPEERPGGYGSITNNLAESSMSDLTWGDLAGNFQITIDPMLIMQYSDHLGMCELRMQIAAQHDRTGVLKETDVMLAGGGAVTALYIIHSCLLSRGSKLLVLRPNYATNLETSRVLGADIDFFDLQHDSNWKLDVAAFCARITPTTRLISITSPHNPTGMVIEEEEIRQIIDCMVAVAPYCYLLVDETYRGMVVEPELESCSLAATWHERVISVASMSKTYGLPGLRMGWLVTRNEELKKLFLAAKEQMMIAGSVLDEHVANQIMTMESQLLPIIRENVAKRLKIVSAWLVANNDIIECVLPRGGVVCFPRIKSLIDPNYFYRDLYAEHGTVVGPGHWFQPCSDVHFRLGFGWPTLSELKSGLESISTVIRSLPPISPRVASRRL